MILPMPRRGGPRTASLGAFDSAFAGIAAIGLDIVKRRRARIERGKTAGQVEDLAVQNQTRLLAGCRAITDKLHGLYNIQGSCKTASRSIALKEARV